MQKELMRSQIVAGNRDNIGNCAATLRQISYEEKLGDCLSSGELDSLIRLKYNYSGSYSGTLSMD